MQYSISDLEHLSGISVHNIRIWERRYGALKPLRTAGNTRYYDDEQLKRLLSITALYHAGHKISRACSMSKDDMFELLQGDLSKNLSAEQSYEFIISQIISSSLVYDEHKISSLISTSISQNGLLATYKFVIYPTLMRIGLMWLSDLVYPSQEHFLSQIIRQKLFAAIDACPAQSNGNVPRWLLFLPEDDDHDIGLLLANYLLRANGQQVIYLGPRVPLQSLADTGKATQPQNLLFFITRISPIVGVQTYIDELCVKFPDASIYLSGNKKLLTGINYPANIKWLKSPDEFEQVIAGA